MLPLPFILNGVQISIPANFSISCSTTLLFIHEAPAKMQFFLCIKYTKHISNVGPLYLFFLLPRILFLFRLQLECHLWRSTLTTWLNSTFNIPIYYVILFYFLIDFITAWYYLIYLLTCLLFVISHKNQSSMREKPYLPYLLWNFRAWYSVIDAQKILSVEWMNKRR